jgi:hypothetical protein
MAYTWQYYDLVLFGIVSSMAAGAGLGTFTDLGLSVTVPVFALVAVAFIGHGLFVNGPVDAPDDLTDEVETLN